MSKLKSRKSQARRKKRIQAGKEARKVKLHEIRFRQFTKPLPKEEVQKDPTVVHFLFPLEVEDVIAQYQKLRQDRREVLFRKFSNRPTPKRGGRKAGHGKG